MQKPKHGMKALTPDQVRLIRKVSREGRLTAPEIAKYFPVVPETIRKVLRGETYCDVPDEPEKQA